MIIVFVCRILNLNKKEKKNIIIFFFFFKWTSQSQGLERGGRERSGSCSSSAAVEMALDDRIPPGKVFMVIKCEFTEFQSSWKFQNFCCFSSFPEGSDRLGSKLIDAKAFKSLKKIDAVCVSPSFNPHQP